MAGTSGSALERLDAALTARRGLVLAVVLGVALLVRVVTFVELHDSPLMGSVEHSQMDMRFFHQWAQRITGDDPLGREPLHPMHQWHKRLAGEIFLMHPERIGGRDARTLPDDELRAPAEALWREWYGGRRFHQEPLYAYFVATVYSVFGADPRFVFALQMLGGVLAVWLLFSLSTQLFGRTVALGAGLCAATYGPLIHFECQLLRVSFITLAGIAVLRSAYAIVASRSGAAFLGFGGLLGLATALKSTFLVVGIGLLLMITWRRREDLPRMLRCAGLALGGAAVVLLPVFVRNAVVGAPLFGLTSVGPVTVAAANVPGFVPVEGWNPFANVPVLAAVMRDHHDSLVGAALATVAAHESFGSYCGLLLDKLLLAFCWYEMPNNTTYYLSREYSFVLAGLGWLSNAVWILPAGIVGFAWALSRRLPVAKWGVFLLASFAPLVVFYVLSRFRVPFVVALTPFAGYAVVHVVAGVRTSRRVPSLLVLVVLVAGVLFVNREPSPRRPRVDAGYLAIAYKYHYAERIEAARQGRQPAEICRLFEEFLGAVPEDGLACGPDRPVRDKWDEGLLRDLLVRLHPLYIDSLTLLGEPERARAEFERLQGWREALAAYDASRPEPEKDE